MNDIDSRLDYNSQLLSHTETIAVQLILKHIQAVPPNKTVFDSRLARDTTSDELKRIFGYQNLNFLHPGQNLHLKFRSLVITTTLKKLTTTMIRILLFLASINVSTQKTNEL